MAYIPAAEDHAQAAYQEQEVIIVSEKQRPTRS
jgi:hypothetical protein